MTRNLCRHADKGRTGHACTRVIGARATQGAVFANNRPVLRRGDPAMPHTILHFHIQYYTWKTTSMRRTPCQS
jgi:hypothetical protein